MVGSDKTDQIAALRPLEEWKGGSDGSDATPRGLVGHSRRRRAHHGTSRPAGDAGEPRGRRLREQHRLRVGRHGDAGSGRYRTASSGSTGVPLGSHGDGQDVRTWQQVGPTTRLEVDCTLSNIVADHPSPGLQAFRGRARGGHRIRGAVPDRGDGGPRTRSSRGSSAMRPPSPSRARTRGSPSIPTRRSPYPHEHEARLARRDGRRGCRDHELLHHGEGWGARRPFRLKLRDGASSTPTRVRATAPTPSIATAPSQSPRRHRQSAEHVGSDRRVRDHSVRDGGGDDRPHPA